MDEATWLRACAKLAKDYCSDELKRGVLVAPLRSLLRPGTEKRPSKLLASERIALRAWVSQGLWTPARWAEHGYALGTRCEHCGAELDDPYHRIVECSRSQEVRLAARPGIVRWLETQGRASAAAARGLLPAHPEPLDDASVQERWRGRQPQ